MHSAYTHSVVLLSVANTMPLLCFSGEQKYCMGPIYLVRLNLRLGHLMWELWVFLPMAGAGEVSSIIIFLSYQMLLSEYCACSQDLCPLYCSVERFYELHLSLGRFEFVS